MDFDEWEWEWDWEWAKAEVRGRQIGNLYLAPSRLTRPYNTNWPTGLRLHQISCV